MALTKTEYHILQAVSDLGRDASGHNIRKRASQIAIANYSVGEVYATTDRLEEDRALLTSYIGLATAVRGWRAPKFFALTRRGQDELDQYVRENDRTAPPRRGVMGFLWRLFFGDWGEAA